MAELKRATDVTILGGGVVGLAIAHHCAQAGLDVVLLEPAPLRTTLAGAPRPVRAYQPGQVHDSELTVRSLVDYRSFHPAGGADLVLTGVGWLVVLTDPEQAEAAEAELAAHRAVGVEFELLTAAQAVRRNPWLDPTGIELALWCPQSYLIDVDEVVRGYTESARAHGARLLTGVDVTGLDPDTGRVASTAGEFTAETVVIAAGALSAEIAALAGLELPMWPQFAELFRTDPLVADGELNTPFTVHPRRGLKTLGTGRSLTVGHERLSPRQDLRAVWAADAAEELGRCYPRLAGTALHSAWAGSLDVTATRTALIGRASGRHERIVVAAGYTGQDLGQAAGTGRIILDIHLGRRPPMDLAPFSPSRTTSGVH
jgi:sarcosine oxidase subunit beta